jgi:hypothetical protein
LGHNACIFHRNAPIHVPFATLGGDLNIQRLKRQPLPVKIKAFALSGHLGAVRLQGLQLGDDHFLLRQTLFNRHEHNIDLTLFLLDLGELALNQRPGHTLVLPEVVNQALLLFLERAQSPLQLVAVRYGGRVWTLLLAPLQLGCHQ